MTMAILVVGASSGQASAAGVGTVSAAAQDVSTAAQDTSDGFPWTWVIIIAAVIVVGGLVLAVLASSVGMGRRRAQWHDRASSLVQEGLVLLDLAAPIGSPEAYGLETLMAVEDRLDLFVQHAGPIRRSAPSIQAKELIDNLCHSASMFAAALAADRAIREGVSAKTAQQQSFSMQRAVERRNEFDLNVRELSWRLDEWP